jgi:hypothetical protein
MPVFALLHPIPSLARLGDPRGYAAEVGQPLPVQAADLLTHVAKKVAERLRPYASMAPRSGPVDQSWYWMAPLLWDDETPSWIESTSAYGDSTIEDYPSETWLARHAYQVAETLSELDKHLYNLGRPPEDLAESIALMAVAAPANMCWRALDAVVATQYKPSPFASADLEYRDGAIRDAAVRMAQSLRSLFSQPEAEAAVLATASPRTEYWRAVMEYSLSGGLPAVLEENLHMLVESNSLRGKPWEEALSGQAGRDDGLASAFSKQVLLRANPIRIKGMRATRAGVTTKTIQVRHHFAVRYGSDRLDEKSQQRAVNVREAFNGPFWPFVLVSTSVGQEGLDFHPYSHAVVHWNLPHNPVDLEQREGRVHRYKGHAVRKNVATVFGSHPDVLTTRDPWEAMFALASEQARREGHNDLVPFWVFPVEGGASIERHVPMLALSQDIQRYRDLTRTLGLYRLSFGQPRQDDLLALLESAYEPEELQALVQALRIDLAPYRDNTPRRRTHSTQRMP